MTLIVELSDNQEPALKAKAQAHGLSAEDYVRQLLTHELDSGTAAEPFWKTFTNRVHSLPEDVLEDLPADGASEHDHYLYGSPKRNQ